MKESLKIEYSYCEHFNTCCYVDTQCSGRATFTTFNGDAYCTHRSSSVNLVSPFEFKMRKAIEESSKGRTEDFESSNIGSIPISSSKRRKI